MVTEGRSPILCGPSGTGKTHPHGLVIDEVGYLTVGTDAANLMFQVVNNRYLHRRPMLFTTHKPLAARGLVLHDSDLAEAILDRILERWRLVELRGPSYRTRHLKDADSHRIPPREGARISGKLGSEFPEPHTPFQQPPRSGTPQMLAKSLSRLNLFYEDRSPWVQAVLRFGLIVLLSTATFLILQRFLGTHPNRLMDGIDASYYYAFTRSLGLEGEIHLDEDYKVLKARRTPYNSLVQSTGYRAFAFPIGFPVLELPFFWIGLGLARVFGQPAGGLAPITAACYFFGVIFYGMLGLMFCFHWLRLFYSRSTSIIAVVAGLALTNLVWYFFNAMSHAISFMTVSLFLYAVFRLRDRDRWWHWGILGLVCGLMFLVRWQDILFGLILVVDVLTREGRALFITSRGRRAHARTLAAHGVLAVACGAAVMFPQLLVWKIIYGAWLTIPQGETYLSRHFDYFGVLFSSSHGWISWHPVVGIGLLGTLLRRKGTWVGLLLAAMVVLQVTICSRISDVEAGYSFGMRRLVSSIPVVLFGLARILEWILQRRRRVIPGALIGLILLWFNIAFVLQYKFRLIPAEDRLTMHEYFWAKSRLSRELAWRQATDRGEMKYENGEIEDAIKDLDHAVDICPEHTAPYQILKRCHLRHGNRTAADRCQAAVVAINAKRLP